MSEQKRQDSDEAPLAIEGMADKVASDQALELIRDIEVDLKEKLPRQEQTKVMRVVREVVEKRAAFFSGPQPPPELIAEYERVAPGWGIRILEMGEREQLHRHECDAKIFAQNNRELDQNESWIDYLGRGQTRGFIAFLVIGAIGTYALFLHFVAAACVCLGTFAIGVITAFIKGGSQKSPGSNNDPKDEEPEPKKGSKSTLKK
jgi:uncharacterized membrane protein